MLSIKSITLAAVFVLTNIASVPLLLAADSSDSFNETTLNAHRLRCEHLVNPLGIDETVPRLSWALESTRRGHKQSAYQILVSTSQQKLDANEGDAWDSGKVSTDNTTNISYEGQTLTSSQQLCWKVRSWDEEDVAGQWSQPACWEMAILNTEEWQGKWIAQQETPTKDQALPLLRRGFELNGKVNKARVSICGLGYHELYINGSRIGDSLLDPGYTRYDKRLLYVTHDVTEELKNGDNALGVMLGNGWFNVQTAAPWNFDKAPWRAGPRLLLQLQVEFEDGRTQIISTDEQWKTTAGPITRSSIYGGESYDANLEHDGWSQSAFDDSKWKTASLVTKPTGKLSAQCMPPIRSTRTYTPTITEPEPGVFVCDFGQNMAGFVEVTASAPAGSEMAIVYSELLNDKGRVDQQNIATHVWSHDRSQTFQTDKYRFKGKGTENWHARFTYHGFRYVEIVNPPFPITPESLKAHYVHTDLTPVGNFECSNELLNSIWKCACFSYLNNLHGIPTDCPHREKNGWTGDAHIACEFGLLNYDGAAFYTKWITDLQDEQQDDGNLPGIVPTSGWGYSWGNGPAWDSAYLLIPDYLRTYCGDNRLLKKQYEGHRRYVDFLTRSADGLIVNFGLGDWAAWKTDTPAEITSTAYFYRDAMIVAETARRLGDAEAAKHYSELANKIRDAFNQKYFDKSIPGYTTATQTSLSCALYQGLVEPAYRQGVIEQLAKKVAETDNHIDTGILGSKYLLTALSDNNRADLAYQIASQDTQPSWGWWIRQGATTLWEQWTTADSHNHIMFGDVAAWFTKSIVGLTPDENSPGFANVIIAPNPVGDLEWAKASYDSIRGPISVSWHRSEGKFQLDIEIPANTTGTVYLPTAQAADITEGGELISASKHLSVADAEKGKIKINVTSGKYSFVIPFADNPSNNKVASPIHVGNQR